MRASTALAALVACMGVSARAAADGAGFRWSRAVETSEGWTRLALPDDVAAACRPGLPDVRLRAADGSPVPYVIEQTLAVLPHVWPLRDVESTTGRETTGVVDRGAAAPLADALTLDVAGDDFLKPIVVEASDGSGDWKEIARGSIFATASHRMTTVGFAPNDRRLWRIRLDNRNGPPVVPRSIRTAALAPGGSPPREVHLEATRSSSEHGESTYAVLLPSANLAVSTLRLEVADPAFSRQASVYERFLFREQIDVRLLGSARIERGLAGESLAIRLGELRGPALEFRVADGPSPPLSITGTIAVVEPRSLLFFAPRPSLPVTLDYGSSSAEAPSYDLATALAAGRPSEVHVGALGAASDRGASSPVGLPPHGAPVDASRWRTRAAIHVPSGGGITYLSLDGADASSSVRIVDAQSREVPFLFDRSAHPARQVPKTTVTHPSPGATTIALEGLSSLGDVEAVELTATAPDYFVRGVTVVEALRDARGPVGERVLGGATWERRPGEPPRPLRVAVSHPTQTTIEARIDDGSNSPIALGPAAVERAVRRVEFVSAPGESLYLLAGDGAAGAPSYDLAMVADQLLRAPAQPATLEPAVDLSGADADRRTQAKWFWAAVVVAGLVVAAALARAVGPRQKPG
jgi:hypothetical protein